MTQNNEAFEKWYKEAYPYDDLDAFENELALSAWYTSKYESDKEIAQLKAKVTELDGMLGKRNLTKECEYLKTMAELQADNERLREALETNAFEAD